MALMMIMMIPDTTHYQQFAARYCQTMVILVEQANIPHTSFCGGLQQHGTQYWPSTYGKGQDAPPGHSCHSHFEGHY
jgi:hypothetical protein